MSTKSLGFAVACAIALMMLSYADSSFAAPKKCGGPDGSVLPGCGGGSDDGDETLNATWNLDIVKTDFITCAHDHNPNEFNPDRDFVCQENAGDMEDDGNTYEDSNKGHVLIIGGGGGFRFDTNLQNVSKMKRFARARTVFMDFDDADGPSSVRCEIDFRFNQTIGLVLGSLDAPEEDGMCHSEKNCDGDVAATLLYYCGAPVADHDPLNYGILGFGALNAPVPTGAAAGCVADVGPILVTRTGPDQWTLESQSNVGTGRHEACRFTLDANGDRCISGGVHCEFKKIDFQFKFIITPQP